MNLIKFCNGHSRVYLDPKDWSLWTMDTTPEMRGKGHATSLMSDVVAFIDDCGKDVWLYAKPARKGLNQDQLETFYSKFGFTKVSMVEGEAKMVRKASV